MKPRLLGLAAAGACLLFALAAAGCGEGEDETPIPTSVPLTRSTPQVPPTIDRAVPLAEYRSPDGAFSVSYPQGWEELEDLSGPDFAAFSWTVNGSPVAQLTVLCSREENQTLDGLLQGNAAIMAKLGGRRTSDAVPIEIAGTTGKQVTYARNIAGLAIEQVAAYVVKGDCGWRIGLDAYDEGSLQSYLPLFERIIASFRVD